MNENGSGGETRPADHEHGVRDRGTADPPDAVDVLTAIAAHATARSFPVRHPPRPRLAAVPADVFAVVLGDLVESPTLSLLVNNVTVREDEDEPESALFVSPGQYLAITAIADTARDHELQTLPVALRAGGVAGRRGRLREGVEAAG